MTVTKSNLYKVMHDRKSVRKYDENYKIPQEQLEELLVEATSAPSSSNLQPWRFIVIQDEAMKKSYVPLLTIKSKWKLPQLLLLS